MLSVVKLTRFSVFSGQLACVGNSLVKYVSSKSNLQHSFKCSFKYKEKLKLYNIVWLILYKGFDLMSI